MLVFGGGVIPDADARALKEQGVAEIFQPGSSLRAISAWLEQALDDANADSRLTRIIDPDEPAEEARVVDLFEYQGKQYFARYDIPVSPGDVAYTVDEAVAAAEAAGYPVVVKAQVQVGGRGKAGGIKLADNADEVRLHAGNILGMDIKGHLVKRVWVEHASDIEQGVLRLVLARPWRQEAPADAQRRGRRRDRDGRRDEPRRDRAAAHRPGRRPLARRGPRRRGARQASTPRRSTASPTCS